MATRSPLVAPAVTEAIKAAGLDDRDKGLVMLARRYAAVIDDAEKALGEALEGPSSGRNRTERTQLRAESVRTLVDLGPEAAGGVDVPRSDARSACCGCPWDRRWGLDGVGGGAT